MSTTSFVSLMFFNSARPWRPGTFFFFSLFMPTRQKANMTNRDAGLLEEKKRKIKAPGVCETNQQLELPS